MKSNPAIIDRQLDILEEQTRDEAWKSGHDLAMLCLDIEDLVSLALETLAGIRRHCARFNADIRHRAGPQAGDLAEAERLASYWERWHNIALRALNFVDYIERQGHAPAKAGEFRQGVNEAEIGANRDRVLAAQRRLESGGGRSLEDIENGLSHQTR